jgi:predicted DsbA family dithiol-disulfide isomerase
LHPETPAEGITLAELFAGRNVDIQASQARMRDLMAQEGLPYGQRLKTYNSRLAQELGKWADTQPDGESLHDALFQAYFVDGKNIGDLDTLVEIASSVRLSGVEARQVLETRRYRDAVDTDWQRARELGITGVPTFVANGRGVVGAQPYEVLERLVLIAGGTPRRG